MECSERGLDPFQVNLVVADPTRSRSTICLAITPAMKKLGVKNRCRIHEIPPGISYITAMPRMQLYLDYSARIYSIYLRYASQEDIHIYSVDECFLDVTRYLSLYRMDAMELARTLMKEVFHETKITATAGIGTNLYLAKIAMDILAKHSDDHIAFLDEFAYRKLLWAHMPLTDFWRIGHGTAARLARYGIYTMGDIARVSLTSEDLFFRLFGTDAELLIDHAWGKETCRMEDIKAYRSEDHSLSNGQVLMRNYSFEEARVVLREMTEELTLDMVRKKVVTDTLSVYISYDHRMELPPSGGTVSLADPTSSSLLLSGAVDSLYLKIGRRSGGIRRLNVTAMRILPEGCMQFSLFQDPDKVLKERKIQDAVLKIKDRYGKNAILKASSLLSCSTQKERNCQIGGHRA